jgi:hypothetical protein
MLPPQPPPPRPSRPVESLEVAAQRQRDVAVREAASAEMVRRIEQDPVLMLELEGPLRKELVGSGLQAELSEAWPPARIGLSPLGQCDDMEAYKKTQKLRYVREAYENAVGRMGRQLMLRQGAY